MKQTEHFSGKDVVQDGQDKKKQNNSKFLVCISPSPSSAKCIRWTAKTAAAFCAPWTALYVENLGSRYFTDEEKQTIRANMALAERLGAEVVTLNGYDVATVVAEYAKLSGITNIVIGKSRNKKTIKNLFQMNVEDKLISLLSSIEIHIIPDPEAQKPYREPDRNQIRQEWFLSWGDAYKTLGLLVLVTILSMVCHNLNVSNQNVIMLYFLFVLIVSRITMGYAYGIFASVFSVLAFNFFFTVPYYTFNTIQPGYSITFVIMLLVALITSTLTVRVKTQARLAVEREHRTQVLYEINRKLLLTHGLEHIVALTNEYLTKLFACSVVFYTQDPDTNAPGTSRTAPTDEDASFLLLAEERAVAHWVFQKQKPAGAGTDTLIGAGAFYMPVISQGKVLGVIGLSCKKTKLSQENRLFLKMIVSLVAMALEYQNLSEERRRIFMEAEKEKMRSNLLRAISHDLRTPLTGILGASSVILENGDTLDQETYTKLVVSIKDDAQWLIRMVENLLSVTRIKEGTMNVAKKPEAAEEIVAEAVSRIRKRYPGRKLAVKVPDDLLLVPMDGTLIEQVLINLMENAVKHSPEEAVIEVQVRKEGQQAVFEVADNGEGIAEQDFAYLFESYVPNGQKSADSVRGMGIGLSICKSIIKAHQGKIDAANKKTGGAAFWFTLPLKEESDHE